MRILTVNSHEQAGGAERIATELTRGYREHGHTAMLAVGYPKPSESRALALPRERTWPARNPLAPPSPDLPTRRTALRAGREDHFYPSSWDILDLAPERPDLLHLHNLHSWYFDLRALPWLSQQVPTVLTLHDAWLLSGHCAHSLECDRYKSGCGDCPDLGLYPAISADATASNWRMKRELLQASRLYVASPSRWLMQRAEGTLPRAGLVETRVIPQGVATDVFRPGDRSAARARLGLPADAFILLFCANSFRHSSYKDPEGLRLVLTRLSHAWQGPPLLLLALGDEAPDESIGPARLVHVPFQSDPRRVALYYQAADLYVHAARAETFPNVIMEALCCGLPVVASAVGGIPEQVAALNSANGLCESWWAAADHDATGLLYPAGAYDAMAEGIASLARLPELRHRLAENAAATAPARFDMARTVAAYLDWFADILDQGRHDPSPALPSPALPSGWALTLARRLEQAEPVSRLFGFDRGTPVDRVYIEAFLATQASSIRGRVLEAGDDTYTRRFGGDRVKSVDILHATPSSGATLVGDLADPDLLPEGRFDCIILTQVLHFLPDMPAALRNLRRALAPGGVLLATLPGITQISRYDMDRWGDRWRLTRCSANELLKVGFPDDRIELFSHGNAAAATAFLNGLAAEELPAPLLMAHDMDYEVVLAAKVTRCAPGAVPAHPRSRPGGPLILNYHRVTSLSLDPQRLAVRPDRFAGHLEVLRKRAAPMPLAALLEGLRRGDLPDLAVAVTFDDGYADNLHLAAPLLAAHEVPATVFVTAGAIGSDREFWWDELERLFLWPGTIPERLFLPTETGGIGADFTGCATYSPEEWERNAAWTVLDATDPTPRHAFYRRLSRVLHTTGSAQARLHILEGLAQRFGRSLSGRASHRALSAHELRRLAGMPGLDIGAHTMGHGRLSLLEADQQRMEIADSKARLTELTGRSVSLFAYPYGDEGSFTAETRALVKEAGFAAAVTTQPRAACPADDLFALPRLTAPDCDGDGFADWLERAFSGQMNA
ncbi:polysaccharide deacetylase family protein [Azospirillum formosense]|uniref:Chitooligosaccharide deacetylase n=1 Tax=Azospirillum formosense TaxID=861533 RepID=A0ABX2KV38_9PROT|nr:polysaccharide deacetylase family protein [Azospirillum formosense]MBY3757586.1 polysaccharide deacetylase family protein [Azospirillum formosense]NUB19512.1 polysaccharide deacetylase family protein [Azospirillum formosense]